MQMLIEYLSDIKERHTMLNEPAKILDNIGGTCNDYGYTGYK